ncbi:tripartite ATP-independent transporter DctP family solute receptor [Bacillus ectoiniformans]|uniref:TRAP transporter substrate-binding protein n=1 Tax=Bacillus ectoiniformans TaxID=1494429 RepID=UPI00195B1083|nr:DctP family TRAP transporter solute-binding subunit [Bacillus ectoiniformans]MBM7649424.1 tripartite ATP-independent transporter DctP family solute receptor [Bacillus ectoiniformans]
MKKWLLAAAFAALMLSGCSSAKVNSEGEEIYTLRVTYVPPKEQSSHVAAEAFAEKVERESDGRIDVQLYPNGVLFGSDREGIEAVQLGNVEMVIPAMPAIAGFNKKFMVFDLPFLFNSKENAYKALDGELGDILLKDLEKNGLKGLAFAENGYRHMSNNKQPITKPSDMDGIKIRTLENPLHTDTFKSFGANAAPFAFGELYTALQQNTFDAMECPVSLYSTNKFYEVQKYLTLSGHVYTATLLLANKDFYDSLPADLQQVLDEASLEYRDNQRLLAEKQDEESLKQIQAEGMIVNELTEEQREEFKKAAQPVYEKYVPIIGEELVKLAEKANH